MVLRAPRLPALYGVITSLSVADYCPVRYFMSLVIDCCRSFSPHLSSCTCSENNSLRYFAQ